MIAMKPRLSAFLLCIPLTCAVQALTQNLPDACGAKKVNFNIKTEKKPPEPAPPEAGKAQIVLVEVLAACSGCGTPLIRFGMDGAWVGADKGSSYFALDVPPGEHHLCAAWQPDFGESIPAPMLVTFTAEAGKVYYFEAKAVLHLHDAGHDTHNDSYSQLPIGLGGGKREPGAAEDLATGSQAGFKAVDRDLGFVQVSDDEGKSRVRASALSIGTPKK